MFIEYYIDYTRPQVEGSVDSLTANTEAMAGPPLRVARGGEPLVSLPYNSKDIKKFKKDYPQGIGSKTVAMVAGDFRWSGPTTMVIVNGLNHCKGLIVACRMPGRPKRLGGFVACHYAKFSNMNTDCFQALKAKVDAWRRVSELYAVGVTGPANDTDQLAQRREYETLGQALNLTKMVFFWQVKPDRGSYASCTATAGASIGLRKDGKVSVSNLFKDEFKGPVDFSWKSQMQLVS